MEANGGNNSSTCTRAHTQTHTYAFNHTEAFSKLLNPSYWQQTILAPIIQEERQLGKGGLTNFKHRSVLSSRTWVCLLGLECMLVVSWWSVGHINMYKINFSYLVFFGAHHSCFLFLHYVLTCFHLIFIQLLIWSAGFAQEEEFGWHFIRWEKRHLT